MSITASAVLDLFKLFDGSAVAITLVDLSARILRANDRLSFITGYSPLELQSLTYVDFTHPDDLPENIALTHRLNRGELNRAVFEKRYIRKTGEVCWVRNSVVTLRENDTPTHLLVVTEDISDTRIAEQEVLRTKNVLRILSGSIGSVAALDAKQSAQPEITTVLVETLERLKEVTTRALNSVGQWTDTSHHSIGNDQSIAESRIDAFRTVLERDLDRFSQYTGMFLALNTEGDLDKLSPGLEGSALRAVNLLVRHVYRFSGTDAADVSVVGGLSSITVEVSDAGRQSRPLIISRTGTQALQEQIERIGGSIEVFAKSTGTARRVVLPLF